MSEFTGIVKRLEELGPVPASAIDLFAGAFPRVVAVVEDTYEITATRDEHAAAADEAVFLRSSAEHFGRSLEAVYRYGLWGALVGETAALAASFTSRNLSGRLSLLLRTWIMAIASGVRSPEVYALTRPLEILRGYADELEASAAPRPAEESPQGSSMIDALLGGRIDEAVALTRARYDRTRSVDDVLESIVFPVLVEIGARWVGNRISVAEEHAATAALRTAVHHFFDSLTAARLSGFTAAVACVPGDEHELGAEILARYLEFRGRPVYFIGHSAPGGEILREIERGGYAAVLLSVSMIRHLPSFERLVERLRARLPDITIIAGGSALAWAETVMRRIAGSTARTPAEVHGLLARMEGRDA